MVKSAVFTGVFFVAACLVVKSFDDLGACCMWRRPETEMSAQDCRTATGLSSEQRLLKMLQASPEQRAAVDRILLGQVAPEAMVARAPNGPLLMRVKDAAALLGVHRATIWRLVKAGRLEGVELLGSLRVRRADVEALAGGHHGWGHEAAGGQACGHRAAGGQACGNPVAGKGGE